MKTPDTQISKLIEMDNSQKVYDEVKTIVSMMFGTFDFELLDRVFTDIVKLFKGKYFGYQECLTGYHDIKHTTDAMLAAIRLIHGASLQGETITPEGVTLCIISSLMHDTGYIQTLDDEVGTGAKYIRIDTKRSIVFMDKYIADNGFSKEDFKDCPDILMCTGLNTKINEIQFESRQIELLGKILGSADLMGQMADRIYLEKLLFLFYEFIEGGVTGYDTELDLLKKTIDFYAMARRRYSAELDRVNNHMRYHFKARWNLDRDLYMEAIEKNINYLKFILEHHE